MPILSPDLTNRSRTLFVQALNLLFPPTCVGCGRPGAAFCDDCAQRVQPVVGPLCAHCGRQQRRTSARCPRCRSEAESDRLPAAEMLRGAALYTMPLREAIHGLKYDARRDLAEPLARYLVAAFNEEQWSNARSQIDAVIAVPLHATRQAERGYNQAELLAQAFCRRTDLASRSEWMARHQFTRPQVGLSAEERHANVEQAFIAQPAVAGHTLLLIDDVYTTGATLRACAAAAKAAGAAAVYALALALPAQNPR